MGSRVRFLVLQLVLLLGVGILAIGLAEQVARRKYPDLRYEASRQQRAEDLFIRFDPRMGWSNIPGKKTRFVRQDFEIDVSINEEGFRGRAFTPAKPPGVFRVAVLGDSYVFGHGVEEGETFAAQLEARLQTPARPVEVLNLGVIGYSTDQELLLLRDRVLDWAPDLVILAIYRNDVLDNGRDTAWGLYRKPRFVRDGEALVVAEPTLSPSVPWGMRVRRELRSRFVLYDIVAFRFGLASLEESLADDGSGDPQGAAEQTTRRLLEEFAQTCAAREVPVIFLVVPPLEPPSLIEGLVDGDGARVLDPSAMFTRFQAAHPESTLGFTYDSHWNATAHRLVADTLARAIVPKIGGGIHGTDGVTP